MTMIELRHVCRRFETAGHSVLANDDISFSVKAGSIHALAGENGAGKSTLLKIIFGLDKPTQGEVFFKGVKREAPAWNPYTAFQEGLGMVHQHFMLAGPETVLDNICLGVEKRAGRVGKILGLRDRHHEAAALKELMDETGLKLDLFKPVQELSVGEQSRVEILKVLYRKADCIILDEPTAVLAPQEVANFLNRLKKLKSLGKTIVLVTHKLHEVMSVADEVTVLRRGKVVDQKPITELNIESLATLIVGKTFTAGPSHSKTPSEYASVARIATTPSRSKKIPFGNVVLRDGEILGVAGVEGNGQDQLIAAFCGDFRKLRKEPVAVMAPDRHHQACVLGMSVEDNFRLGRVQASSRWHASIPDQSTDWENLLKQNDVRPPELQMAFKAFSGGNQQKVIVARELYAMKEQPKFILAAHPTRGVDLGAVAMIHERLVAMQKEGAGILLLSSELSELMALSHRIIVLYRGAIAAEYTGPHYDENKIGQSMLTGAPS